MGYPINKQAFLASFSFYFLFFGHKPQLATSTYRDVTKVVNLDDPHV
jgi:hypothetical protein